MEFWTCRVHPFRARRGPEPMTEFKALPALARGLVESGLELWTVIADAFVSNPLVEHQTLADLYSWWPKGLKNKNKRRERAHNAG